VSITYFPASRLGGQGSLKYLGVSLTVARPSFCPSCSRAKGVGADKSAPLKLNKQKQEELETWEVEMDIRVMNNLQGVVRPPWQLSNFLSTLSSMVTRH